MSHIRGFTFLEVLASLLVISLGMTGVITAVHYGQSKQRKAMQEDLAMPTAMTVLVNQDPFNGSNTSDWDIGAGGAASGYINGFFVERSVVDNEVRIVVKSRNGGEAIFAIAQPEVQ